ncbi:MAG: helix-turn-helix transcriptional regulator [Abitibacteriaceae bacterium]|nr:helix-turn-helix transcriptional regulator [Abditibacteriaceae bacterium]MBV9866016.1 helix-turn-helix transcriptional regulator [Abditibacteriaceae bacterium]
MKDEERYKLLFGPYKSPKVQIGDQMVDEIRGPVVVGTWSKGKIPWPCIRTAGRSAFVLTGDLVEAVKNESSLAIQYWWGVSPSTVHRWRKTLGTDQYNEGTLRLHREWKPEKISAADARRGQRKGASPESRAKMTAKIRARGFYQHSQRVWTKEEEAILGTMPDPAAAEKLGRTLKAVGMWRRRMGIPAHNTRQSQFASKSTIPLDAEKLTKRRLELRQSQKAIAKKAGMDPTHLSQLETGFWRRMKPDTMKRLAKALKCQIAEIATDEYNQNSES